MAKLLSTIIYALTGKNRRSVADLLLFVSGLIKDQELIQNDLSHIYELRLLPADQQYALENDIYAHFEKILCPKKYHVNELREIVAKEFDVRYIRAPFVKVFLSKNELRVRDLEKSISETSKKLISIVGFSKLHSFFEAIPKSSLTHGIRVEASGKLDFHRAEERFWKMPLGKFKNLERSLQTLENDLRKMLISESSATGTSLPLTSAAKRSLRELGMAGLMREGLMRSFEQNLVAKSGVLIPAVINASALRDADGKFLGAIVTASDLREVRRLQQEKLAISDLARQDLQKEKNKLLVTLQSIGDGAMSTDSQGLITFFNPRATEITGYSVSEALGKHYREVFKVIDEKSRLENYSFIEEALNMGQQGHIPNLSLLITKNKKEVAIADSAAPIVESTGEIIGCIVIFRNVSEERKIDKAKTEFISLASHQLRTPLTAIRWNSELLLANAPKDFSAEQTQFATDIQEAASRMAIIVNNLLNISRIEAGRVAVEMLQTDCGEILHNILKILKPSIKTKQISTPIHIENDLKPLTDPRILSEILSNLLSNAVKYTKPGGKVETRVTLQGSDVKFSIKDNGIGILKKQQNRVFEKFFRGDNVVKIDTNGTGLGLYITRQLVEMLGGKIWFESKENQGSTFTFTIPLAGVAPKKGEVSLA